MPIFLKLFNKGEIEGIMLNVFHEVALILIPKPHNDPRIKEKCIPIYFINIISKVLNKILVNQI